MTIPVNIYQLTIRPRSYSFLIANMDSKIKGYDDPCQYIPIDDKTPILFFSHSKYGLQDQGIWRILPIYPNYDKTPILVFFRVYFQCKSDLTNQQRRQSHIPCPFKCIWDSFCQRFSNTNNNSLATSWFELRSFLLNIGTPSVGDMRDIANSSSETTRSSASFYIGNGDPWSEGYDGRWSYLSRENKVPIPIPLDYQL